MARVSYTLLLLLLAPALVLRSSSEADHLVRADRVRQISWKPRAFVYDGFLTAEECDHLISLAKSELKRSEVADSVSGDSELSDVRTSSGMFISKGKDSIISRIEEKIAAWTFLPKVPGFGSGAPLLLQN